MFLFAWSVFLMLLLHIVEILIWAFALNRLGLLVHAYDAIYFCANGYTTLGMGKMDIEEHWRILGPIIGISGLFTFAWTTSALVDVVASNRRLLEQLEDEREQEIRMRFALRKKEWDALKTERAAERAEADKTKTQDAGFSFMQRLGAWREERKRVAELRRENRAEMKNLRWQERFKEREGEAKPPTSSPEDKDQK
ncbi:MAG TPA: ion channel [Terriglobales bacterium]